METIWAIPIGEDRYVLDNSPFCAYSVSWKDTVHAPHVEEEGLPTFVRILSKSGHRTVRVIFDPPVAEGNASDRVLKGLLKLGCTYEAAHRGYMKRCASTSSSRVRTGNMQIRPTRNCIQTRADALRRGSTVRL